MSHTYSIVLTLLRIGACVALISTCADGVVMAAPTNSLSAQIESRIPAALNSLHRFQSSRSLDDLDSAVKTLSGAVDVSPAPPQVLVQRRRSLVKAWAAILLEIESLYDPTFNPGDPNDLATSCVVPLRQPTGMQLQPCADPSQIADPRLRAQYIAEIKANDAKLARSNYQTRLRDNIDPAAMLDLQTALRLFRGVGVPQDFKELESILIRAGITENRRKAIDRMF